MKISHSYTSLRSQANIRIFNCTAKRSLHKYIPLGIHPTGFQFNVVDNEKMFIPNNDYEIIVRWNLFERGLKRRTSKAGSNVSRHFPIWETSEIKLKAQK